VFKQFDYMLDVQVCYDQFDTCVQYINNASRRKWKSSAADEMVKIYNGSVSLEDGLANMQALADRYTAS
jgi:multiple sugar transport system substrate-binding protein